MSSSRCEFRHRVDERVYRKIDGLRIENHPRSGSTSGDEATREHYAGLYARPGAGHGGDSLGATNPPAQILACAADAHACLGSNVGVADWAVNGPAKLCLWCLQLSASTHC